MYRYKPVLTLSLVFILFTFIASVSAQVEDEMTEDSTQAAEEESNNEGGGVMDTLMKAFGNAAKESLQEEIEDFIGTYKGHIGEVKFLERRGNSIVLEVKYEGVKRKDGVYVQGEVLQWGEPLEGFKSTLSPIKGKSGSVILTIGWQGQVDSDWGVASDEEVTSDQIRLALVRETNPERPFGDLVYDFTKTWTDSSEIETPEETTDETEGAIELAEGETAEGTKPASPGITTLKPAGTMIATGAVLKPTQVVTVKPAAPATASTQITTVPARPVAIPIKKPVSLKITAPNYYLAKSSNAAAAVWKSSAGKLKYPGSAGDRQGFVLTLANGTICPDNKAKDLLETHPQWVNGGNIEGRYPLMILGNNYKFKAVGAMLKGAANSDGVIMSVGIFHNNRITRVLRKRVNCSAYQNFEVDLSSWAGKEIQIVLQVSAGSTSTQDWAVWVHPRLTNQ